MPSIDTSDIYYPVSWIKTTTDLLLNLFNSPQKTKRSLPEEAECGSLEGIKCWLREGKKIQIKEKTISLIMIVRCLGADIDAADAYGYTPLMNAAMLGRVDIVKALIDAGADIQKKGQFGYTALHAAAQNGHLEVVQTLVKYGASVNCKNDDGDIPLILGKIRRLFCLINFSCFPLFFTAVRGTHAEIIDYLLKSGSDIHQNGWLGQSAVHTASAFSFSIKQKTFSLSLSRNSSCYW